MISLYNGVLNRLVCSIDKSCKEIKWRWFCLNYCSDSMFLSTVHNWSCTDIVVLQEAVQEVKAGSHQILKVIPSTLAKVGSPMQLSKNDLFVYSTDSNGRPTPSTAVYIIISIFSMFNIHIIYIDSQTSIFIVVVNQTDIYWATTTSGTSSFTRFIVCLMWLHQSSILDFKLATCRVVINVIWTTSWVHGNPWIPGLGLKP